MQPFKDKDATGEPVDLVRGVMQCEGRAHELLQDGELESRLPGLPSEPRVAALLHRASMAEVAETALHNVGNVLNSASVSASLVSQRLRASRVQNINKASDLLREHQADLPRFLAEDPKGRLLPAYLQTLGSHLLAEHAELLKELDVLTKSLEHMKEIVAVQQSYARKSGTLETLQPAELVEDALRMNWAAFERHGVAIVRQFTPTPAITVDKHKVLQILVNLIRNAKYAMDEAGRTQKVLTLEIAPKPEEGLVIRVRDNGIGIPAENLVRIFDHGFTTKREGHGFGLHSGALAAAELGGKLSAQSEGVGQGATFCLELPCAPRPLIQNARGTSHQSPSS